MGRLSSSQKAIWGGVTALLLTIGIARFAYTPLLPTMQAAVRGFGDFEGGLLAAGNYAGYLSGALLAALLSDIGLKDRLYRWSLVLAVVTTAAMAFTTDFVLWLVLRTVSGFTSAAGLILCSGLVMHFLISCGERLRMGLYFGGVGLGLALSAAAVNLFNRGLEWQGQWIALGILGVPLAWVAHRWVPKPQVPHGAPGDSPADAVPGRHFIRLLQLAYFCAGFGYVVSATFLVDMLAGIDGLTSVAEWAWLLVGLAAAPSCIAWEWLAAKLTDLKALMLAYLLQIGGIALPVVIPGPVTALVGAVLFGATFMGIVALVLTMVGRLYPHSPAKPMGQLTLSFGLAQILGPAITGWLAETHGGYAGAMVLAAGILAVGLWPLGRLIRRQGASLGGLAAERA